MDVSKFFAKKSDLSHQSNNGEVNNKRNHRLANPKQNKHEPRPIIIKFVRHNFRWRIFFKQRETLKHWNIHYRRFN